MNRAVRNTVLLLLLATIASARLENGTVVRHPAGSSLSETLQKLASEDSWITYELPSPASRFVMCCFDRLTDDGPHHATACRLGGGNSFTMSRTGDTGMKIDTSTTLFALHQQHGTVTRVEVYSGGCPIDATGKTVHALEGVTTDDSLRLLEGLVPRERGHHDGHGVLAAVAMHDSPRAAEILERTATGTGDDDVRGQAIFWLAQVGGRRGFEVAKRLAESDPDRGMRKKSVFALTQSAEPGVFDALTSIATHHADNATRGEAFFWLGQTAGLKALPLLRDRLDHETSNEVREKIIFAISQIDAPESTRELVQLARGHADPGVRRKAIFWLGQKAGRKLDDTVREAVDRDPDSEVREMAVFAISQRPHDEAIPALIDLAESHRDLEVRKKAIFWLSQMNDPRALAEIEKLLLK